MNLEKKGKFLSHYANMRFAIEKWQINIGESVKTPALMSSVIKIAEGMTGFKFEVEGKWGDFTVTRVS